MDDDWDLQAVVRGCTTATTTSTSTTTTTNTRTTPYSAVGFLSFSSFQTKQVELDNNMVCFQDLFESRNESSQTEDLYDLYKPFSKKTLSPLSLPTQSLPLSPLSVLGNNLQDLSVQPQQQQVQLQQHQSLLQTKKAPSSVVSKSGAHNRGCNGVTTTTTLTQSPRSKRRKNQMKRVCQVPAEGLSSDVWSWRKYGQKPIKGSPYPRGYYRCSTSKGCLARKQVERNRSDPSMFIITYTAEHNHPTPTHRNSLAGSTRNKPTTSCDTNKSTSLPPTSPADSLSTAPEKLDSSNEEKEDAIEEDEDDFSISDMPMDDDFFAGLDDELARPGQIYNDCFSDHFPANGQFPWLASNATTTLAGGG